MLPQVRSLAALLAQCSIFMQMAFNSATPQNIRQKLIMYGGRPLEDL